MILSHISTYLDTSVLEYRETFSQTLYRFAGGSVSFFCQPSPLHRPTIMPERPHAGGFEVQQPQITENTPLLCSASTSQRRSAGSPLASQPRARGKERLSEQCQENANDQFRPSSLEKDADLARSLHHASSSSLRSPSTSSTTVEDGNNVPSTCSEIGNTDQSNWREQHWRFLPEGVSLRLENSGSVARDHLASERTFLAYMRTSLAIASSGVGEYTVFHSESHKTTSPFL